jgi:hypothetical protein
MTLRQQIVTAVITRLKTITVAGGYSATLTNNVFEWPALNLSASQLPAAIVTDPGGQIEDAGVSGRLDHTLQLEVELLAKGATAPAVVRELVGDVLRAIGTDPQWSTLAVDTTATGVQFAVEEHECLFAGAQLNLSIMYRTAPWAI